MRLPLRIHGVDFTIATDWPEVRTREFFAIRQSDSKNVISLLAAVSGQSPAIWENVSAESVNNLLFTPNKEGWYPLKYMEDSFDFNNLQMPKVLTIDNKAYIIPNPLDITLGQKLFMEEHVLEVVKHNKDIIDAAPFVLACMFYPVVTGKPFTKDDAGKFVDTIMDKTFIVESYPLSAFFLLKLFGYENEILKRFPTSQPRKSVLQELTSLMYSGPSGQLMPLQVATSSKGKKSSTYLTKLFSQNFGCRRKKQHSKDV